MGLTDSILAPTIGGGELIQINTSKKKVVPVLHFDNFNGGYSTYAESQINDDQSANCQNVLYDGRQLNSREGQSYLYPTTLGAGAINGEWDYKKKNGTTYHLIHHTTKLYTQTNGNQPVLIFTGLVDTRSQGYTLADFFFILDGTNFKYFDGTTVLDVTSNAYIPTISQGRNPAGITSSTKENFNFLSDSWIDSFTSDGTSTVYTLSSKNLNIALASVGEVKVNGVVTVAFTTQLANSTITFTTAPTAGTNNVTITGTSTGAKDPNTIKKNKYFAFFGSRVWLTGNPDNPASAYWSGLTLNPAKDPFYFPDNNFVVLGSSGDPNSSMNPHNDSLIMFKEHSTHRASYVLLTDGTAQFNFNIVNYTTGCDMPYTVQMVNNDIVFSNTYKGVCILRGVVLSRGDERSIDSIGANINGTVAKSGFLDEQISDLKKASSIDDGKRYWISIGSKAWAWDYVIKDYSGDEKVMSWWPQTNINANCWLIRDKEVFYGDRTTGLIVQRTKTAYNDFSVAINKSYRFKKMDFKSPEFLKNINFMWIIVPPGTASELVIRWISDDDDETDLILATMTSRASWLNYKWDTFTWRYPTNEIVIPIRPNVKNTQEFSLELSNNQINQNLAAVRVSMKIALSKEIR